MTTAHNLVCANFWHFRKDSYEDFTKGMILEEMTYLFQDINKLQKKFMWLTTLHYEVNMEIGIKIIVGLLLWC